VIAIRGKREGAGGEETGWDSRVELVELHGNMLRKALR